MIASDIPDALSPHGRGRCLRLSAHAGLLTLLLLFYGAAHADPGPIGSEYPVENRELPPKAWWTFCTDSRGITATLSQQCFTSDCRKKGNLLLTRTDSHGATIGEPVQINESPAWMFPFRVTCGRSGYVVVQWKDALDSCFLHRVFDPDGNATSPGLVTLGDGASHDCRIRPNVAVADDGTFTAAWAEVQLGAQSRIFARKFEASGEPAGDAFLIRESAAGYSRQPKIAFDDGTLALIAWLEPQPGGPGAIAARYLDGGEPSGDAFVLNTFERGTNSEPAVTSRADGLFEVVWANPAQGGRVARLVALDAESVVTTTTTTTTVPLRAGFPRFGAAHTVDSVVGEASAQPTNALAPGRGAKWLLDERPNSLLGETSAGYRRTVDDGVSWSAPATPFADSTGLSAIGGNGANAWVAVGALYGSPDVYVSRSADDAQTWSEPLHIATNESGCKSCQLVRGAVKGQVATSDAASAWVVAWSFHGESVSRDGDVTDFDRVYAASSIDGGRTWREPVRIAEQDGIGSRGFDLDSDGATTWILMWADEDLRVSRSTDGGRTWSAPKVVASAVACTDCASAPRYTRIDLTSDGLGRWAAVFASASYLPERYGRDGDVFVVRSDDDGATWSTPAALTADAERDAVRDLQPSIATTGAGVWVTTWTTHRPLGGKRSLEAEVAYAASFDVGATWTAPLALDSAVRAGNVPSAVQREAVVAADERGVWLAAWRSEAFAQENPYLSSSRIRAAAADAECGNKRREAGESCDDGNSTDSDGCDSDCSLTGCGNGIVTASEECDDGNHRDDDACVADCHGAVCGDGYVFAGFEQCDDGNLDPNDECPNCGLGTCGDGYVIPGVEECDPGATPETCTPACKVGRCGDGYVQPRKEACDDGNDIDTDACPNDCSRAICGDGSIAVGFEECEPGKPEWAGICTDKCKIIDICGDSNGDQVVTAGDAYSILRCGVGATECPVVACDMNLSGTVTVSDAKMALDKSIGIPVGDRCSIGTGMMVFWIDYEGEIGALQLEIEYGSTGGSFYGYRGGVACEALTAATLSAFNDEEERSTLIAGLISVAGIHGPTDIFRCVFELPADRTDVRLHIAPAEATEADGTDISPRPRVGYRLEMPGEGPSGACGAGDGLLRAALGARARSTSAAVPVGTRCSLGTGSVVFWSDYEGDLRSLQVQIYYGTSEGDFDGIGHDVDCQSLVGADAEVEARFNDEDQLGLLGVGLTSTVGFHASGDLFRCNFALPPNSPDPRLLVLVREAVDLDWNYLDVASKIGYRLE